MVTITMTQKRGAEFFNLQSSPETEDRCPGKLSNEEAYGVSRDVFEGIRNVGCFASEGPPPHGEKREVVFGGLAFEIWAQGGDGRVDVLGGGYLREVGSSSGGGSGNGNGNEGLQSS